MKPVNTDLIPLPDLDRDEMVQMQVRISEKAVFHDEFDFSVDEPSELTVVGIDQAFTENKSVSVAVVMKNGNVVEEKSASSDITIPYIPGLLAFREGRSIVKALEKIDHDPDILFLDGSGRIHFREAGIATHIGLIYDKPAIGIAKKLLCGKTAWSAEKLQKGRKIPVKSDKRVETAENKTIIGYLYQSKQYEGNRKVNPLYISPGHRISAETATKLTEYFSQGYKLPEPTRIADKRVSEIKKEL